jgi:uncharacterized protein YlxW (UPF0749 family)
VTATTYKGSAREQWALAGIDLALGRITAAELHALGEELIRNDRTLVLELDLAGAENRAREDEYRINDLEKDVRAAERETERLKAEIERLKRKHGD